MNTHSGMRVWTLLSQFGGVALAITAVMLCQAALSRPAQAALPPPGDVTVGVVCNPANDPGVFRVAVVNESGGQTSIGMGCGEEQTFTGLPSGRYTVQQFEIGNTPWKLADYSMAFGGDCDANGVVQLPSGGTARCTITRTRDSEPPVISVPAGITVNASSPSGAVALFVVTTTDNTDPDPDVVCTPPSGSVFAIGTTTVYCTATDAAGNTANAHFTVYVKGAVEQLVDLHRAVIGVGPGSSLADKVQQAETSLGQHNVAGACATLNVFINQVTAQSGKGIPPATATALIADANRIRAVLGC